MQIRVECSENVRRRKAEDEAEMQTREISTKQNLVEVEEKENKTFYSAKL
jgi:hypothetical protein